jgi:hypothetical protein
LHRSLTLLGVAPFEKIQLTVDFGVIGPAGSDGTEHEPKEEKEDPAGVSQEASLIADWPHSQTILPWYQTAKKV